MKNPIFENLKDAFKSNSLKNMSTIGNNPSPHKGNEFYVWNDMKGDEEISSILNKGNKWGIGKGSISVSSYISLSNFAYEEKYYCIENGPNSNSSSNTVRFIDLDTEVRIIAEGWGSSHIVLWEGKRDALLEYLKENQNRGY